MSVDVPHGRGVQVGDDGVQVNVFAARPPDAIPVVVGNVPHASLSFQPREDLVAKLVSSGPGFSAVSAITGMRGAGKTQVAAAYARQCIDARWRLVAWVDAEDMVKVLACLAAVAGRLGIGEANASLEATGEMVRGWLESDGERCLIVFDNVTDLAAHASTPSMAWKKFSARIIRMPPPSAITSQSFASKPSRSWDECHNFCRG